jgi:hypothetical protein
MLRKKEFEDEEEGVCSYWTNVWTRDYHENLIMK